MKNKSFGIMEKHSYIDKTEVLRQQMKNIQLLNASLFTSSDLNPRMASFRIRS